jgi:hypothetical protein
MASTDILVYLSLRTAFDISTIKITEIAEFEFKPTANKSQESTVVGTTSDH